MASDPRILAKRFTTNVTLSSGVSAKPGDLIGHDGTGYVLADADTGPYYARFIATQYIAAAGTGEVAREVWMEDDDAPYTLGNSLYLSTTGGAHTGTRPTTAGALRQVVGQAMSTSVAHMKLEPPKELQVQWTLAESTSGEAALGSVVALDSGTFEGQQLNANAEYVTYTCPVPDNAVGLVIAEVFAAQEAADSSAATYAFTVASVVPGTAHDAITADTSLSAGDVADNGATDPVYFFDCSAAFDATNIVGPNRLLAIKIVHNNATDATLFFGGRCIFRVV